MSFLEENGFEAFRKGQALNSELNERLVFGYTVSKHSISIIQKPKKLLEIIDNLINLDQERAPGI